MSSIFLKSRRGILMRLALGPVLVLVLAVMGLSTQLYFLYFQHSNLVRVQSTESVVSSLNLSLETQSRYWSNYLIHFELAGDQQRWDEFRQSERATLEFANRLLILVESDNLKEKVRHIVYSLEILRFSYQEARNSALNDSVDVIATASAVHKIDSVPSQLIKEVYFEIRSIASQTSSEFWGKGLQLTVVLLVVLILGSLLYLRVSGVFTSRLLQRQQEAQDKAKWLLEHDYLTRLLNRTTFFARMKSLISAREPFYLLNIKLTGISAAGHAQGQSVQDDLICMAASRLETEKRPQDVLARSIGEEFLLLIRRDEGCGLEVLAKQLLARLNEDFTIEGYSHQISCFMGVAYYPSDASDIDALTRCADIASVHAHRHQIPQPVIYSTKMSRDMQDKSRLVNELRVALQNDELDVHYQPQLDFKTGVIVGVEVLARLTSLNPDLNSPAVFIPLAEESGLIHTLGKKVARQAFTQLNRWHLNGFNLRLAINVSPRQLEDPGFAQYMQDLCIQSGIKSADIDIEIIESDFIDGRHPLLKELRASGFGLSIDDFGTGYSNLGYLSHFMPHQLKIDKTFVDEIDTDERRHALVQSIVNLAHSQGIEVVAEGVESEAQAELLASMGADIGQGYWFSRPLRCEALDDLLVSHSRPAFLRVVSDGVGTT